MAKRKRRKSTGTKRRSTMGAKRSHRRKRRRTLSAGGQVFKMLSNPIVGGLAGAAAGYIAGKAVRKVMHGSPMGAVIGAGGVAILLYKRAPFAAGGAIASAIISPLENAIAKLPPTSMVAKLLNEDANFVNDGNLLNAPENPIILSAEGDTIPYKLADVLLQEMDDAYYGGGMSDMDDEY